MVPTIDKCCPSKQNGVAEFASSLVFSRVDDVDFAREWLTRVVD
jgi:hypothetical protein